MNHKEILLYGFHFSFIFIFTLAVLRDVYFVHYFNASINFFSLVLSIISYYLLHVKFKENIASNIIMFIAIFPLYFLIYFNHFGNMVIVYVILLPIAAYFLLAFKKALIVNLFMYLLLIGMLYYIYTIEPNAPILSNPLALINIAFASLFIMFFGIFYHMAVESSLTALIRSNRQKDILLKEVHHRVKNNLNVTASILGLQANGKSDETKEELLRSKERIEAIAIVHEMLYKQEDFEDIYFNEYVTKLNHLILQSSSIDGEVKVNIAQNESLSLPLNIMIQFGLIINEILTNSLKHAKNKDGLQIDISLMKEESKYIFNYQDNGENKLEIHELSEAKGLGLRLINLSVKQLGGELKLSYNNGLRYEVRFEDA